MPETACKLLEIYGGNMGGITFLKTVRLDEVVAFYTEKLGMRIWLKQADCVILRFGNMLLGFCQRDVSDTSGILTFVYETSTEVDEIYSVLKDNSLDAPHENSTYNIYQFFSHDPEGRLVECQAFLHPVPAYSSAEALLVSRRSIRRFRNDEIPEHILAEVFESCRYSPTSRNSQSYFYQIIRDDATKSFLAGLRGESSAPIARAPLAVAVYTDPSLTKRPEQDGCIAAYHLLLAAALHGLGTCWIAAMDRPDVKERLGIPEDHYIATVTPLGYPDEEKGAVKRREWREFVTGV